MKKKGNPTSFRLSDMALDFLLERAKRAGINKSAMLEIIIRVYMQQHANDPSWGFTVEGDESQPAAERARQE